ncbi:hypothetical protein A2911_01650 [Candidatus Nomurabacteria bacterium RIFCSPLOWO2_01_FULL_40_15]|uniref:Fibronectin type-III domain-containing protein n=1 Tax=Candidatus Nomurabacteria bacterium RIFCSPLOWO2_01_FULL_40_15 TaxID=1801772 RepID=A0A1F6X8A4_9BACT|nr:MAG: hypothetical protein A2911_01650 [Candidatus Nomurabacteria bacterium RIFCSPLOWO2_01_FULL_40_15]
MNKKSIQIFIFSFVALVGLLTSTNLASASTTNVVSNCSYVTFNGYVTPNGNPTTAWFEWGTSTALGNQTNKQTFTTDSSFSQMITGLSANTTYYYRAMATSSGGNAVGEIISFTTPTCSSGVQPSVTLYADDSNIDYGDNTTVRWSSNNATSCTASGGANGWSGLRSTSGSFYTGSLTSNKTFTLVCTSNNGNTDADSVTINVGSNNGSSGNLSVDIYADDTSIDRGDSTRIHWNSNDADECTASGGANGWSGKNIGTSGSFYTGSLTFDKTFRITCENFDGNDTETDSVTIRVSGSNNSNRPDINISADRTNINFNESTTIRWNVNDADDCYASGGSNGWSGSKSSSSGSFNTGILTFSSTYTLNCSNDRGSRSDSVTVNVGNYQQPSTPVSPAPTTVTLVATQVTSGSAQLNSLIFSSGNVSPNAWFEWGTSASLGNSTTSRSVGSSASSTHSDIITGLVPGARYYYRAVVENVYGRSYGSTLTFLTTNNTQTPPTTVVRNTTVINNNTGTGTKSLVMLTIDGGQDSIALGEARIYHVEWENISGQTLSKVVLRILLPQSMSFENTNRGRFSSGDNTITLDLDTLSPGKKGDLLFTARAGLNLRNDELVVVVANLVYTNASDVQGDVVAYATHHAELSGSVLGASAFGAGFLPNTFLGWLFLLILLLIILLLSKHLYDQSRESRRVAEEF